jgi:uncharacterized protein YgiM (DUF1202 family)
MVLPSEAFHMAVNSSDTSSSSPSVFASEERSGGNRLALIIVALLFGAAVVLGAIYLIRTFAGSDQPTASEGAQRAYRTTARLDLRAEPSQSAPAVATLKEGTNLAGKSVGLRDGVEWLEVTAADGVKGFVPATLVKEFGPASGDGAIRLGDRRVIVSTLVNLRASPSLSGRVIGVADGGTRLRADGVITAEGEDWLRVPIDGKTTAYVMQRFTTADDDAGGDGIEQAQKAGIGVLGSVVAVANVQATPLPDSRIVRALQVGEEVRIIGQTNAGIIWYVLRLSDGSQGFAPRDAIRVAASESRWVYPDGTLAPGPNIPKGAGGIIAAQTLDVRATPSNEAEVVGTVSGGQVLVVTNRANGWLQIRLPSGNMGFVPQAQTRARIATAPRRSNGQAGQSSASGSAGAGIGAGDTTPSSNPADVPVAPEAAAQVTPDQDTPPASPESEANPVDTPPASPPQ